MIKKTTMGSRSNIFHTDDKIIKAQKYKICAVFTIACIIPVDSAFSSDAGTDDYIQGAYVGTELRSTGRFSGITNRLHAWQVVIGGGVMYAPEYEGSDKFKLVPAPVSSAQFGEAVHLDPGGVTVDLISSNGFNFGVTGGIDPGRKERDSSYLRGLGDIDMGGVLGGVVRYETGPFEFYASLDKTFGGSKGLTGTFGARATHQYDRFVFSADLSSTWADDNYMTAYFGVTPAQAAQSGLPKYEAKSGIKRVDATASVTYVLTENWSVTGAAGAGLLLGDAKNSPIVKDDIQPFALLTIGYRF